MFKHTHKDLITVANDLANSVLCPNVLAHLEEWQELHCRIGDLIDAMTYRRDVMLIVDDLVAGAQLDGDTLDHLGGILDKLKDSGEPVPPEFASDIQVLTGAMTYSFAANTLREMWPELQAGIETTVH